MSFKPLIFLVTLPAIVLLVTGIGLATAFNRMPPADNIIGMNDMFEIAESEAFLKAKNDQELAMLETKS